MAPYGIDGARGWPAVNYFYNTNVDDHNNIWFDEPWSRPGDYVLMGALSDLVCGGHLPVLTISTPRTAGTSLKSKCASIPRPLTSSARSDIA